MPGNGPIASLRGLPGPTVSDPSDRFQISPRVRALACSGHTIGESREQGLEKLTLSSEALGGVEAAFIPAAAMLCRSLRHRGDELLGERHGLAAYVKQGKTMGIPLLHPWANRIASLNFTVAQRQVSVDPDSPLIGLDENGLPIHGLNTAMRGWELRRREAGPEHATIEARLGFDADELLTAFPFPHELLVTAELREAVLTIRTEARATSDAGMPVSFGYHPYLQLPGVPRADWDIEVPVTEQLSLDERGIPTGERETARIAPGPLGERTFDDAFTSPPGGTPFVLAGPDRRIDVAFSPDYPYAQLFAPPDDEVICFEPMTAPTNALVDGGAELPTLSANERYSAAFSISLSAP